MTIEKVTNEKWLNLYKSNNWLFSSRKNLTDENFKAEVNKADAIVIVATQKDTFYLIEQYREPIQDYEISFPAGLIENGESLDDAVRRELKEETGLDLVSIEHVSPVIYSSSGMTDESVMIVWCTCEGETTTTNQESDEQIRSIIDIDILKTGDFIQDCIDKDCKFGAKAYLILLQFQIVAYNFHTQKGF